MFFWKTLTPGNSHRKTHADFSQGAILDEIQRVPALFSYLQGVLDEAKTPGLFILTGSHNFLLMAQITQSLAGRVALLSLLPLSWQELSDAKYAFNDFEDKGDGDF